MHSSFGKLEYLLINKNKFIVQFFFYKTLFILKGYSIKGPGKKAIVPADFNDKVDVVFDHVLVLSSVIDKAVESLHDAGFESI